MIKNVTCLTVLVKCYTHVNHRKALKYISFTYFRLYQQAGKPLLIRDKPTLPSLFQEECNVGI